MLVLVLNGITKPFHHKDTKTQGKTMASWFALCASVIRGKEFRLSSRGRSGFASFGEHVVDRRHQSREVEGFFQRAVGTERTRHLEVEQGLMREPARHRDDAQLGMRAAQRDDGFPGKSCQASLLSNRAILMCFEPLNPEPLNREPLKPLNPPDLSPRNISE